MRLSGIQASIPLFISLLFFLYAPVLRAQDQVQISTPGMELIGEKIIVSYDILNTGSDEEFMIWIEVTDSSGRKVTVRSLKGDIGKNVKGGSNKTIIWDYSKDHADLEGGIYVQILAENITSMEVMVKQPPSGGKDKGLSRGGVILRSAVFPGWGLTKLNDNKSHLFKGIAAYACLGASVYYNKKGLASFTDYQNATDISDRESFYDNAVKEDGISELLAYSAIGIWVADMVWTIVGSANMNRAVSVNAGYDPVTHTPVLALSIKF